MQRSCRSVIYLPSISQAHYLCLRVIGGEAAPVESDSYDGTHPFRMIPPFLKRTDDVLAPRLSVVFRQLSVWVAFLLAGDWLISPLLMSPLYNGTLSGRIGKVVASHAEVARWNPAEASLIYTMHEVLRGTAN